MRGISVLGAFTRFGAALLYCAVVSDFAQARTWRVEKDGSGDFIVIQDAVDAAAEGDSVLVGPGRYDDFRLFDWTPQGGESYAIIGLHRPGLTVIGADSSQVVLGPELPVGFIDGKDAIAIAVNHGMDGHSLKQLTIENVRWGGIASGAASFRSCRFQKCSWSSLDVTGGTGMRYERCSFSEQGVVLISGSGTPISSITFTHCVFGPQADRLNIQTVQNATVEYCFFSGNGGGLQFSNGSTGVVRYCRFENNYNYHVTSTLNSNLLIEYNWMAPGAQVSINGTASYLTARHNYIGGGVLSTVFMDQVVYADQLIMTDNDILNGGDLSVRVFGSGLTNPPIELDFSNNYWGTTDTAQIDEWIWDDADSHRTIDPIVRYLPLRESSIPNAITSMSRLKGLFEAPR